MKEESSKKKKSVFLRLLKRIKPSRLIFLAILLVVNTYAWFIYVDTVSNQMEVHVKSWKIDFTSGDTPVTDYVNVFVDNVYPGMTTYTKTITAYNYSEVSASATYKILSASIMGDEYITEEGRAELGESVQQGDLTSDELEEQLAEDYPFSITLAISTSSMVAETGSTTYEITIAWPYESGDDELDTEWGTRAYDFKQDNPTDPCISLVVKIYITQSGTSGGSGGGSGNGGGGD